MQTIIIISTMAFLLILCLVFYLIRRKRSAQVFDTWKGILDRINSTDFRDFMKQEMAFNIYYVKEPALRRSMSLKALFDSVQGLVDDLEISVQLAECAPRDKLVSVSELAGIQAWNEVRDRINVQENETPEEYMTRKILQIEIDEDGNNEVFIPLQLSYAR